MIDHSLTELDNRNLTDWGVICLGYAGIPGTEERLGLASVKEFANRELETIPIDDALLDLVVDLATGLDRTSVEVREALESICHAKGVDMERSARKWRVALLKEIMEALDPDPTYSLIRISGFWQSWGWPDDSPPSMRIGNITSFRAYHSQAFYEHVIKEHNDWLMQEIALVEQTR